jgi:Flp pilus assembly protein TadB
LGAFLPDLVAGRGGRDAAMARGEAIATWAEMLRDMLSGAHGLEEVIVTTAPIAPMPIRDEVLLLAARLPHQRLAVALRRLADDLADPTADLVVAALVLAAQGSPRELGELLGTLAIAARDEASMRRRVEAARARARSTVQVVSGVTVAMVTGLLLLNRSYLSPYDDALGQLVLTLVSSLFGLGLWWLARMARFAAPERFLSFDAPPKQTPA